MGRIYIPTQGPSDWKRLLAKPDLHWKAACSAMTAAACWDAAGASLPHEVSRELSDTRVPALCNLELVAAFPEWETALPGGDRASCTDVMAIARNESGLVAIGVEAKVEEPFGPTVGEKRATASAGQAERLKYLESLLRVPAGFDDSIRYQLLHRTASAVLTARKLHAPTAVLLVHSFSPAGRWRPDFDAFVSALGTRQVTPNAFQALRLSGPDLFLVWCPGDLRFLESSLADQRR